MAPPRFNHSRRAQSTPTGIHHHVACIERMRDVLKACDTLCAAVIAPSRAPAGQLIGLTRSLLGDYLYDARASWPAFSAHIRAPAQAHLGPHLGERFTIEIGPTHLDVVWKATVADAFALALKRTGQTVGRVTGKP